MCQFCCKNAFINSEVDFKFSLDINPDLSSILGDFSPSAPATSNNSLDPFLQEPFNFMATTSTTNTVLDENDQKAFSSFLDAFFLDPDMQPLSNNDDEAYYCPQEQSIEEDSPVKQDEEEYRRNSILQSLDKQKKLHQRPNLIAPLLTTSSDRTTSLVTSSRNNKRMETSSSPSEEDNTPQTIYLRTSESLTLPYNYQPTASTVNTKKRPCSVLYQNEKLPPVERSSSVSSSSTTHTYQSKKSRVHRELLTEEEKRANHIASEQKRRSTIRNGFKDLTDLIPTLKNISNSKSTVLFKAVEFIRYLEKRNKHLREKMGSLEVRVEVEGRMTQQMASNNVLNKKKQPQQERPENVEQVVDKDEIVETESNLSVTLPKYSTMKHVNYEKPMEKSSSTSKTSRSSSTLFPYSLQNTSKSYQHQTDNRKNSNSSNKVHGGAISPNSHHNLQGLPANARNALLAHKTQQKQLLLLQEQLQMHQRLIARQQDMKERSLKNTNSQGTQNSSNNNSSSNKLPPILTHQYDTNQSSLLQELDDKAISAP